MRAPALVWVLTLLAFSLLPLGCSQTCDVAAEQMSLPNDARTTRITQPAATTPAPLRFGFGADVDDRGVPAPWVPTVSAGTLNVEVVPVAASGMPTETTGVTGAADAGSAPKVLRIRSEKGSFLLTNRREFDPIVHRRLRWRWKATVLPQGGDVRKSALIVGENRNDQAIQLLIGFENNRVLSFVWDTTAPVDTEVDEPSLLATVKTRVLDSGDSHLGEWRTHEIDLAAEYERRFGEPPTRALGVTVQCNANHTASISEGLIGEIEIEALSVKPHDGRAAGDH
jgi:hypothetical protein